MSLYKRGDVWWYKFRFAGQMIRESSKSKSKTVAKDAERVRRRELEESWNQIKRRKLPPLFSLAAADWIKTRTSIAPSTERSYKLAISQLTKDFGKQLLCDLCGEDLATYQTRRKRDGVSNRTVNLEMGVMRSILRRYRMWEPIAADVDFLKENSSPGRALCHEEEARLLEAASKSRCRSLYPVVMLAINTGMRASEIRGLKWEQVDFLGSALTVGKSKTLAGTGRIIPLNPRALAVLTHWRVLFSGAQPEHRKRHPEAVWTDYVELTKMAQVGTSGSVHLENTWTLRSEQSLRVSRAGGGRWQRSGGSWKRRWSRTRLWREWHGRME